MNLLIIRVYDIVRDLVSTRTMNGSKFLIRSSASECEIVVISIVY